MNLDRQELLAIIDKMPKPILYCPFHAFDSEKLVLIDKDGDLITYGFDDTNYKDFATPILYLIATEGIDRAHKDFDSLHDKRFGITKKERRTLNVLTKISSAPSIENINFEKLIKILNKEWVIEDTTCSEYAAHGIIRDTLYAYFDLDEDVVDKLQDKISHYGVADFVEAIAEFGDTVFDVLIDTGVVIKHATNSHIVYFLKDLNHAGLKITKLAE